MSRMMMLGSLLGISVAMFVGGCNIENCERGAHCMDGEGDGDKDDGDEHEQCLQFCERMSVCGAPQANDFQACIAACEDRFEVLPQQTARLCECIPRSRCEDVIDGRCTDTGSGGSSGTGGSHSTGGSSSQGGSNPSGGSDGGGSPGTGGSSGNGGSAETGGSPGTGGAPETGGMSTGGSATGGAGGEPGIPCTVNCECPSGQTCVDGYCSG
jgi:hypothetical protein